MAKSRFLWALASVALLAAAAAAQRSADKYLISARAGGVNFVTGQVSRVGVRAGQLLKGDSVGVGERISTGETGRAEILMNPGSYIRLGTNSEFSFESVSLDDLRASLYRGSAIFEVYATDRFQVKVTTPTGVVRIADSGVYRFDLDGAGHGTLAVLKGKAQIEGRTEFIKEGRQQQIGSDVLAIKFDKALKADELAMWSRDRSKDLARVTSSLSARALNDTLLSSFRGGSFGLYDSFGLWVFDPMRSNYCFLPFGWGWRSPYGFGFGSGIDWWSLQRMMYSPGFYPRGSRQVPGSVPSTAVAVNPPAASGVQPSSQPAALQPVNRRPPVGMPPFAEIQRQQKVDTLFDPAENGYRRGRGSEPTVLDQNRSMPLSIPSQSGSQMGMPSNSSMPSAPAMPAPARGGHKASPIDD